MLGNGIAVSFVERRIDEAIFDAKVWHGNEIIVSGVARLYYCLEYGQALIRFYGQLDEDLELDLLIDYDPLADDPKLSLTGITISGFLVAAEMLSVDAHFGEDQCFCNLLFQPYSVVLTKKPDLMAELLQSEFRTIYIDPIEPIGWLSCSDSSKKVELEYEGNDISIHQEENASYATITITGRSSASAKQKALRSTIDGLSFLFAKHYDPIAVYSIENDVEYLTLFPIYQSRPRGKGIFGLCPVAHTKLKFMQLFLEKCYSAFNDHLTPNLRIFHGYLVDTYKLNLYSQEMASGIAVAGFAEYLISPTEDPEQVLPIVMENQKTYEAAADKAKELIDTIDFEVEYRKRLKDEIPGSFESAKERVRRAAALVGKDLEEEDLTNWVRMRNNAAHPGFKYLTIEERTARLASARKIFRELMRGYVGWTDEDDQNQ